MENIIITTCPSVEGYHIIEHYGPVFGEVVYKTSMLKSIGSSFEDSINAISFSAREMSGTMGRLEEARKYAMNKIINEAKRRGGNAIVGLDVESSSNGEAVMHISMVGTAVKIEKNAEPKPKPELKPNSIVSTIEFNKTNYSEKFMICKIDSLYNDNVKVTISASEPIEGIKFHIESFSFFNEKTITDSIELIGFKRIDKFVFESSAVCVPINIEGLKNAKEVIAIVEKYAIDNEIINVDSVELKEIDKKDYADTQIQNFVNSNAESRIDSGLFYLHPDIGETATELFSVLQEQVVDKEDPICRYVFKKLERIVAIEKSSDSNRKDGFLEVLEKYREMYLCYLANKQPIKNDDKILCPFCNTPQRSDRKICLECGLKFPSEI